MSSTGAACRSDPASATRVLNCSGDGSRLPFDQLARSTEEEKQGLSVLVHDLFVHERQTANGARRLAYLAFAAGRASGPNRPIKILALKTIRIDGILNVSGGRGDAGAVRDDSI